MRMTKEEESMHRQAAMDRLEELNKYIEGMFAFIEKKRAPMRRLMILGWICILLAWVTPFYFDLLFALLGMIVMMVVWIQYLQPISKKLSEIEGCFRTLSILGMMDFDGDSRRRRKIKIPNPFEGLSAAWEKNKAKSQREVYGTT